MMSQQLGQLSGIDRLFQHVVQAAVQQVPALIILNVSGDGYHGDVAPVPPRRRSARVVSTPSMPCRRMSIRIMSKVVCRAR